MDNLKLQRVIANILIGVLTIVSIIVSDIFSEKFNDIWAGGLLLVMLVVIIYLFYRVNRGEKKPSKTITWKELSTKDKVERIFVGIIGVIIAIGFLLLARVIVWPFIYDKLSLGPWAVLIILVTGFILYYRYNEAKMRTQKTSQAKHE